MKRILFVLVLMFIMIGCEKVVTFNQPQPEGVDSLTVMPRKLIGSYISKDGASVLTINSNSMVIKYDYDVKFLNDSSNLNDLTSEDSLDLRFVGDSVIEHVSEKDTIFYLSKDFLLKKYKGYYFLNNRRDKDSWYVQKIELKKGLFVLGSISTKDEFKTLERISEAPIDTTTYRIRFSKKQFHNYMDNDGFSKVDTFLRMKR